MQPDETCWPMGPRLIGSVDAEEDVAVALVKIERAGAERIAEAGRRIARHARI
jgi:hypothetical protein